MICAYCGAVFCVDIENDGFWLSGAPARYCSALCHRIDHAKRKRKARRRRERAGEGVCKTPYKRRFATQAEAELAAAESGIDLRAYQCRCGDWHLTSAGEDGGDVAALVQAEHRDCPMEALPCRTPPLHAGTSNSTH